MSYRVLACSALSFALTCGAALAQSGTDSKTSTAPDSLVLYFNSGSASVRPDDEKLLDQASRLYRDGKPLVMIVSGATDSTGNPVANLRLSQVRANNVVQGLVARGIPAERFQVLAKGETAPAVAAGDGVAEQGNRRAEITWK